MKVLIIEDEKPAAQKLVKMLLELDKTIVVLDVIESIEDSINWLGVNSRPDLIFMDIQLDDGVCFEIFESIEIKIPIIFTTAYDEFAIKAFKVNSVDYLLKPIKIESLKSAILKYKEIHLQNGNIFNSQIVSNLIPKNYKERFFIKIGVRFKSVLTKNVICFYIREGNTYLLTSEGKSYDLDYSLDKLEQMIDTQQFFRVNRNFIINIDSIKDIISYSSSRLKINIDKWNEEDIIVSRERMRDFKRWMDR